MVEFAYHHHNTAEEIESYLLEAQEIVKRLDLDPELFRTAFELTVNLLSAKVGIGQQSVVPPAGILRPH